MDSGPSLKPKVTVKYGGTSPAARPPSRTNPSSRPASPTKSYVSTTTAGGDSTFRPRAKVNSSATTTTTRKTFGTAGPSSASSNASTTPRAGSPTKLAPRIKTTTIAANGASRTTLRSPVAASAPVTPETRRTATTSSTVGGPSSSLRVAASDDNTRSRTGSVSLHHAASFSSFQVSSTAKSVVSSSPRVVGTGSNGGGSGSASASPRLMASKSTMGLSVSTVNNENLNNTNSPTLRIRAKVSNLAKAAAADASSVPPSPTSPPSIFPSSRPGMVNSTTNGGGIQRSRAPSISSSLGVSVVNNNTFNGNPSSPPAQFYPITTAVPAANPHRYPASRPASSTVSTSTPHTRSTSPVPGPHQIFQSFSQSSSDAQNYNGNHRPPTNSSPKMGSSSPKLKSTTMRHTPSGSGGQYAHVQTTTSPRLRASGGAKLNMNGNATAKVDPVNIPLPPLSPPASAVSFSSRSSVSRSSASASHLGTTASSSPTDSGSAFPSRLSPQMHSKSQVSSANNTVNGDAESMRQVLDNLISYSSELNSGSGAEDEDDEERQQEDSEHRVKAAAKSNRKIADLEITNRSLLVINASLEATKHRQAKEIAELRRKLRETRLILPPRAYRAIKSSLDPSEMGDDEEDVDEEGEDDEWFDAEDGGASANGENGSTERGGGSVDDMYKRIKMMLEVMLKTGQEALETKTEDFGSGSVKPAPAKVLSPEEVKDWRQDQRGDEIRDQGYGYTDPDTTFDSESSFMLETSSTATDELESSVDVEPKRGDEHDLEDDHDYDDMLQRLHIRNGVFDESTNKPRISEGSSIYYSSNEDDSFFNHHQRSSTENTININNHGSRGTIGDESMTSEDEVEAMTILESLSSPTSSNSVILHGARSPPPILITKPTL